MLDGKYAPVLERNGLTPPQIICGFLCYPDQMRELAHIYKALEDGPGVGGKALENKAKGLRLALFPDQMALKL